MSAKTIKLRQVRDIFRLIGRIRERGADPQVWRRCLLTGIRKIVPADLVISSEVHVRKSSNGTLRVHDVGWGSDFNREPWHIQSERENEPESYLLTLCGEEEPAREEPASAREEAGGAGKLMAVKPSMALRSGQGFILSQYPLPHLGAVDQLGLHRTSFDNPFTPADHRLVRLFHVELGRLLLRDAVKRAQDPSTHLPPRLTQTLERLIQGDSEKQIAFALSLSRHTVHNYVKALHHRLGVSSRAELIAKANSDRPNFLPHLSIAPKAPPRAEAGEAQSASRDAKE